MKQKGVIRKVTLLLTLAVLLSLSYPLPTVQAQSPGGNEAYFERTGHRIDEHFVEYFYTNGGLMIFGYPITESFIERGLLVQYFQHARIEWHPDNPEPYKIQLGLLGDELKYRQPPIPEPTPRSRRRVYFPETGHTIAYTFLDYFKEHGSIDIFGYPITEMYFEDGTVVQYFQRLKMEWHPNDPVSRVRIGDLGELYLSTYRDRIPPEALRQVDARPETGGALNTPPPSLPTIKGIRAVISLRYSVMSRKRDQTVSILVTSDKGEPVPNATVQVHFETSSGEILPETQVTVQTDQRGFAQARIPVENGKTGTQVIVRAKVTYQDKKATAQNVFLLWW